VNLHWLNGISTLIQCQQIWVVERSNANLLELKIHQFLSESWPFYDEEKNATKISSQVNLMRYFDFQNDHSKASFAFARSVFVGTSV